MNKPSYLTIIFLAFWCGMVTNSNGSHSLQEAPFDKTAPKYEIPNNSHPSLPDLIQYLEARTLKTPDDAEVWYQLGLAYSDALRYDRAISALQKALSLDSVHVLAWENLGINLYSNHQLEEGLAAFQRAVNLGTTDPDVWNSIGLIFLQLHRLQESDDALAKGLKLAPRSLRLWDSLGLLRAEQGKYDEALQSFKHALEIDPKYAIGWANLGVLQNRMRLPESEDSLLKATQLDPQLGDAWVNLSVYYSMLSKWKQCRDASLNATKLLPDNTDAWLLLAESYVQVTDWEPAVEAFHQAIDVFGLKTAVRATDKQRAEFYAQYGYASANIHHLDDADKLLQMAHSLDPESALMWNYIAFLRSLQLSWPEALDATHKSLTLDPKLPQAWCSLGEIYLFGLNQPDKAEQPFRKAVTLLPTYGGAWYGLGGSYQRLQKKEEAAEAYRQAVKIKPDWSDAWRYLAACTSDQKEADDAMARAFAIDPNDPVTYGFQGALLNKREDWAGAEKVLRKAVELAKDDALNWQLLSCAYYKQQKYAEAVAATETAIKYSPDASPEMTALNWCTAAECHMAMGHDKGASEWKAALIALGHATDLVSTESTTWWDIAYCNRALGREAEAVAAESKWKEYGSYIPLIPGIVSQPASPKTTIPGSHIGTSTESIAKSNTIKVFLQKRDIENALSLAESQTKSYPEDPLAWYDLGNVLIIVKQYDKAIPCLNKSIALNPKMGPSWFDLGYSLAQLHRFDEALEALTKSINFMPESQLSWEAMVGCYNAKGDMRTGRDNIFTLVQAHPESGFGWCALGDVENALGNSATALSALQKAVALQPTYGHALNSLGLVYSGLQQRDKAIDCFLKETTAKEPDPEAWNNLGYSYFLQQQYDKAIPAYQKAIQINPRDTRALYNLVIVYATQKQWQSAHDACNGLAQISPATATELQQRFPEINAPPISAAP